MPEMSTRPPMIIDCDPGHDDAVAIVTAAHFADVRGIVTVAGNAPLDRTTHNALIRRDLLELDTPVHSGADRPLVAPPRDASFVHGESGLDGAELPEPTTPLDSTDGMRGEALHDPLAVLAVTHPHLFERQQRHVVVETRGEHTAGMTVIDDRALIERDTANCDVLTEVDHEAAFGLILEAIEAAA